jgi:hypothetical protein
MEVEEEDAAEQGYRGAGQATGVTSKFYNSCAQRTGLWR